jgi:hypothetical protein
VFSSYLPVMGTSEDCADEAALFDKQLQGAIRHIDDNTDLLSLSTAMAVISSYCLEA